MEYAGLRAHKFWWRPGKEMLRGADAAWNTWVKVNKVNRLTIHRRNQSRANNQNQQDMTGIMKGDMRKQGNTPFTTPHIHSHKDKIQHTNCTASNALTQKGNMNYPRNKLYHYRPSSTFKTRRQIHRVSQLCLECCWYLLFMQTTQK